MAQDTTRPQRGRTAMIIQPPMCVPVGDEPFYDVRRPQVYTCGYAYATPLGSKNVIVEFPLFCTRLFVSLTVSKILSFGRANRKNCFSLCFSLSYSYLCDKVAKILRLGKKKKRVSFVLLSSFRISDCVEDTFVRKSKSKKLFFALLFTLLFVSLQPKG